MSARPWIRIGTRGSLLARTQTEEARRAIAAATSEPLDRLAVEIIRTTGDQILDRPLAEAGGKGLFTKELDIALLDGRIDCAVHSAKDLPTFLPEGLVLAGCRPREDARDAFVCACASGLATLPRGTTFGSASPRRIAQILRLRPDLEPVLLRGNVETRLRKVETGEVGATILAAAGMKRLGLLTRATALLSIDEFLPAAGQGAVAIVMRAEDAAAVSALAATFDDATTICVAAERAFLAELDASCRTPIACHGRLAGDWLVLKGAAFDPRGRDLWDIHEEGPAAEAEAIGSRAGRRLLARLPEGFFPPN